MTPAISVANRRRVHHFLIYECRDLTSSDVGYSAACNSNTTKDRRVSNCRVSGGSLLAGWAVGGVVSCCTCMSCVNNSCFYCHLPLLPWLLVTFSIQNHWMSIIRLTLLGVHMDRHYYLHSLIYCCCRTLYTPLMWPTQWAELVVIPIS